MLDFSDTLLLTQQLIKIPSITPLDNGCQQLIKNKLIPLGFSCHDLPQAPADNLWATYGSGAPTVVLAGHTDVVAAGDETNWELPPFAGQSNDGYLYGRGALDMKGGLAAQIIAAINFIKNNPDFHGTLALLITSAEEGPSHLGTPIVLDYLQQSGQKIDYCLIGEPSSDTIVGDTVRIGRRGSLHGQLIVHGKGGHVAYPHLADNPIHKLSAFIHEWANIQWHIADENFPATSLQITDIYTGNNMDNVIPGTVKIRFNLRFSPAITPLQIKEKTCILLDKYNLHYDINWSLSGDPFLTAPGKLLTTCDKIMQRLHKITPLRSTAGGTSDGRFIAKICPEVIELGLCNRGIHEINECVNITDLSKLSEIYFYILQELFTKS